MYLFGVADDKSTVDRLLLRSKEVASSLGEAAGEEDSEEDGEELIVFMLEGC